MTRIVSVIMATAAAAFTGGCSTVKIPDIDFFKLPENKHASKDVGYPEAGDAPQAPTDTRSDAVWDSAAKKLIASRDNFNPPESGQADRTAEEVKREFEALKAKVNEYKKDDPQ